MRKQNIFIFIFSISTKLFFTEEYKNIERQQNSRKNNEMVFFISNLFYILH